MFTDDGKGVWDYLCQNESGDESEDQSEAASAPTNRDATTAEPAIKITALEPDTDFDLEAYIADLPAAACFDGDSNLLGATPPCMRTAKAPTLVAKVTHAASFSPLPATKLSNVPDKQ